MMPSPIPSNPAGLSNSDMLKVKHYMIELLSRELETNSPPLERRNEVLTQMLDELFTRLPLPETVRQQVRYDVLNEFVGYGPIQPLLDDPEVSEVMVNGPHKVYVEKKGQLQKTPVVFESNEHVQRIIDRIVLPLGRRVDPDSPTVDARLPDGSRVNAVIPPVAIDGPAISIRKFSKEKLAVQQLIEFGTLTPAMAEFLRVCVVSRLNIVISGGTGSGFIPEDERIVTIEDAAELQLQQDHIVRLETKPANIEGKNAVVVRDLVRNALRMRPDRIVVGECRGGETLDMLQAMNTGHDGSLTTVHANSPRDTLSRLETMVLMAGVELPIKVVRQQISSAIDLIVQLSRLKDGSRKVTSITEVAGMEGDTIILTEIFRFEQTGVTVDGKVVGQLKPSGIRPLFTPRLEAAGFKLPPEVFGANINDMLKRK
jgi:pilus assembly protein CpaF